MADNDQPRPPVGLLALTRAFGVIGVISMGGGRFAFYFHEMVTRRRWLTEVEMLERLAISQLLPGPNVGNLTVLLGQRLRGLRGAALALAATLAPGATLMLALSALYFARGQIPGAGSAFRGIGAAAAGLALATSLQIAYRATRTLRAAALALLTIAAVGVLHVPTLVAILVLGVSGALLFRLRHARDAAGSAAQSEAKGAEEGA